MITDDSVLMLDSAQQHVSLREQHVSGNSVSRDTGPCPIVYPKLCELTHLTASQISPSCSRDTLLHNGSWWSNSGDKGIGVLKRSYETFSSVKSVIEKDYRVG